MLRSLELAADAFCLRRRSFSYTMNAAGEPVVVMHAHIRPGVEGALPGKSASPPLHTHTVQTECFTVRRD